MDARNIRRPSLVTRADLGLPPTPNTRARTFLNTKAKAFLESLPILALADLRLDCLECPFCIEPYQNTPRSERPVRLPCNHVMGKDCLGKWLNSSGANANNNACPTCRAVLFRREDEINDDTADEAPPPQPQIPATREQLVDLRRDVRWYLIGPEHLRTQGQYEQIRDALLAFEASADIMSAAEANILRLELEQASISADYRMRRRREHTGEPERLDRNNDTVSGLLARGRAYETPTYRVRDRIPERPDHREHAVRPVLVREGRRAEGTQSLMQTIQDLGTLPERLSPRYPSSRTFSGLGMGDTETVASRSRVDQSQGGGRERRNPREDELRPVLVTGRLRAEAANRMRSGYAGMSSTRMRDDDLADSFFPAGVRYMETAAEIVQNFRQRLRDFIAFMEDNSGDEIPRLRSASVSDRDMEQVGPEIDTSDEGRRVAAGTTDISGGFYSGEHRGETSLNVPGVATVNRNDIFGGFYTGEDHDDSSRHMPDRLWSELPSPPGRFPLSFIPAPPPMQAGGTNNIFGRTNTGEHHDDSSRHMPGTQWFRLPSPPGRFPNRIFGHSYTGEHHDPIPLPPPVQQTNSVFDHSYTGEHHDDSPRHMPDTLWFGLPSPPGRFPPGPIPTPPPMQAGRENNIYYRPDTGEYSHESVFVQPLNDAGPAPVIHGPSFTDRINDARLADMRAGENFVDQLPDISLDDIPNATGCNICMEPFGSTEDPESPVQLPCGHVMGRKCISRWLETSNSCPLCRHVLFEQGRGFQFEQEGGFLFGQGRGSQFEQEGSVLFGQENFNRSWDNLEPRLQELIRSMTAQEQRRLLQALQGSALPETETVQRERVEVPGVSPEEVEAYRVEFREISRQRAAIDTRLTEIEGEDGLLTSQIATELRELEEDNEALHARLDNFHARYRDLINFSLFNQAV